MVSLITNPIWVVKTRLALQHGGGGGGAKISSNVSSNAPYAGFFDAMGRIARTEGVAGLYKGFAPSLFQVSHGAIQFTAYERLKRAAADARRGGVDSVGSRSFGGAEPTAFECAWLGVASKLIASAATYPSQVVRSRMQQRGNADVASGEARRSGGGTSDSTPLFGAWCGEKVSEGSTRAWCRTCSGRCRPAG